MLARPRDEAVKRLEKDMDSAIAGAVERRVESTSATACAIIPHLERCAALAIDTRSGWRLPEVKLRAHVVPTDQRVSLALSRQLLIRTRLLRCVGYPAQHSVVILENLDPSWSPPRGTRWVDEGDLDALEEHRPELAQWFAEQASGIVPAQRAPWERPGWFERALAWIDAVLVGRGWARSGEPAQVRHTLDSAVLCVPTSAGDLYFKANHPHAAHEGRLTQLLWRLAPGRVPEPIATDPEQGWLLSRAVSGQFLPPSDPRVRGLVRELGVLQRECIDRVEALLQIGCPDWRLLTLGERFEALVREDDVLRLLREDERRRCLELPALVRAAADRVAATGVPDTLVHGDFTTSNALFGAQGWTILDWDRGSLAHPCFDVHLLLQDVPNREVVTAVWDAYLEVWREAVPLSVLWELVRATKPLWAGQYALLAATACAEHESEDRSLLTQGCAFYLRRLLTL
jgi:aminoglycoside phosphotransferase (APT) family kinase protein